MPLDWIKSMPARLKEALAKRSKLSALLAVGLIAVSVTYGVWRISHRDVFARETVRLATQSGGTYKTVLIGLIDAFNKLQQDPHFQLQMTQTDSEGSVESSEQISNRVVDLALVQANTAISFRDVTALLQVYPEVYFLYVSSQRPESTLEEFCASFIAKKELLKVASLGPGSQTYLDSYKMLTYQGLPEDGILHGRMRYEAAERALEDGGIDLAVFAAGSGNNVIRDIAHSGKAKLLSIANRDGLRQNVNGLQDHDIARGALGSQFPASQINTLMTPSILIANSKMDSATAYDLTRFFLENRVYVSQMLPFVDIQKVSEAVGIHVHPGALEAYNAGQMTWLERYSSIITLILSLIGTITGFFELYLQRKGKAAA